MNNDTICAISTPLGQGGIGIIRISGKNAYKIGTSLFKSSKNKRYIKPYTLHHGYIVSSQGIILDEVLVSYMPAPKSYTGEDIFEINCHGGPVVVQTILKEVVLQGARLAEPGEFTLRAFLNGKIDLTKAEAILEIIDAKSEKSLEFATTKLSGQLKEKIEVIKEKLIDIMSQVVAEIDFDEDIEIDLYSINNSVVKIIDEINSLIKNHEQYSVIMQGAVVVLCGEVNAGKSSLLNAILGRERAIVTDIPGTTRDFIEDIINLNGVSIKLIDTAGIRNTQDQIEIIGVKRGLELIQQADLVLLVFDCTKKLSDDVIQICSLVPNHKILAVANKIDLGFPTSYEDTKNFFINNKIDVIGVSAKTGENLDELLKKIPQKILGKKPEPTGTELVPNLRQTQGLKGAKRELEAFVHQIHSVEIDLLYSHLEMATKYLKEITGEITTEDILNNVFANFCIGK